MPIRVLLSSYDWMLLNHAREQEYYFNRKKYDIPKDKRNTKFTENDREILKEAHFNRVAKGKLPYDLYLNLRMSN